MAGCRRPPELVYVDLGRVPTDHGVILPSPAEVLSAAPALPERTGTLPSLAGAQLALSETSERLREARRIVQENRQAALRSMTQALYSAYAAEAEVARSIQIRQFDLEEDALWSAASRRISSRLDESAEIRWPLANRLALLVGFPFGDPSRNPRPESRWDARRYDEATAAWAKLLAENAGFAAEVRRIVEEVEAEIAVRRTQVQIDFTRSLNRASDRAQAEASAAVSESGPDFQGRFAEQSDVTVPSVPPKSYSLGAVAPPSIPRSLTPTRKLRSQAEIEHDLAIWLAQNGYRRATSRIGARDGTQEFKDWIKSRQGGL